MLMTIRYDDDANKSLNIFFFLLYVVIIVIVNNLI